MASSIFLITSHILSLILFLTCSLPIPTTGFRTIVHHKTLPKYTPTSPMKNSLISSPMKASNDVYVMSLSIGTPPVQFSGLMDTGSDLIWTKCTTTGSFLDFFNSNMSETFSKLDYEYCVSFGFPDCKVRYGDGKSVSVVLGQETISIENENFSNVIFGCGTPDQDIKYDGIVGLGRGDLSLISQLNESVFGYCLGSRLDPEASSVFLTGYEASSQITDTQTMPLIIQDNSSNYYISLEGISVGETKLPVTVSDFAISNGNGGMIIDSGTTFTYLKKSVVDMISNEFMLQTNLEKYEGHKPNDYNELEYCFKSVGDVPVPKLVFHFEGADWELPSRENYIYEDKDVACLAFVANPNEQDPSILGNMKQQNMMVIHDLNQNSLSFKPVSCNLL